MPWPEVGKRVGLSAKQARSEGMKALDKMRRLFADLGMSEDYLRDMAHDREREDSLRGEALTAMARESDVE